MLVLLNNDMVVSCYFVVLIGSFLNMLISDRHRAQEIDNLDSDLQTIMTMTRITITIAMTITVIMTTRVIMT